MSTVKIYKRIYKKWDRVHKKHAHELLDEPEHHIEQSKRLLDKMHKANDNALKFRRMISDSVYLEFYKK